MDTQPEILLVDDEENIRKMLPPILESFGRIIQEPRIHSFPPRQTLRRSRYRRANPPYLFGVLGAAATQLPVLP